MSKFCIDAGHSGVDPGACGPNGLQESDVTLAVAIKVKDILESYGHQVILTRSLPQQPETDELAFRTDLANEQGCDVFMSIHCNAVDNPEAHGTETYCYRGSEEGHKLAAKVQNELLYGLGLADRGVREAGYYVLKYTNMVSALAELAFISNPNEEALLASDEFQYKAANGIAQGLMAYVAE